MKARDREAPASLFHAQPASRSGGRRGRSLAVRPFLVPASAWLLAAITIVATIAFIVTLLIAYAILFPLGLAYRAIKQGLPE